MGSLLDLLEMKGSRVLINHRAPLDWKSLKFQENNEYIKEKSRENSKEEENRIYDL